MWRNIVEWFNNLRFIKVEWSSLEQYHSLIWIALGCLLVYCIFLGATQKIIFYKDKTDCFLTFAIWPLSFVLVYFSRNKANLDVVKTIVAILIFWGLIRNIFGAWILNPGYRVLSVPVGIAKFLLGFVYMLTWFEFLAGSKKRRATETMQLVGIIGLLSGLISYLINGKKVLARRELE